MGCISDKTLKYFTYEFKKTTNLGKFYLLPKIHKRLENVPGRPMISNCGAPNGKTSEFLDFHLKSVMQNGALYIKDFNNFKSKIKSIDIPNDALLIIVDVVGLYPSIPHMADLSSLRESLDKRTRKEMPTEILLKWQNLFQKTTFLSLILLYINRFQVLLLGQNLHHLMRAFLRTSLKPNF